MKIIDELLFQISLYVERGMEFFISEMLTLEGIIAMVITFFVSSLVVQIRS
jgi:hypothetical protein